MSEPVIMYSIGSWSDKVKPVKVLKITAKFAFVDDPRGGTTRLALNSRYQSIHPTWEEAHAALLARAERSVASLRQQLDQANAALDKIKVMEKP